MSDDTTRQGDSPDMRSQDLFDSLPASEKPARKSAKKAAKKAAKKTAKKAAKKAPARKAAKKAAARKPDTDPPDAGTAAAEHGDPPRTTEPPPESRRPAANDEAAGESREPRFGRVPGGGPVQHRDQPPRADDARPPAEARRDARGEEREARGDADTREPRSGGKADDRNDDRRRDRRRDDDPRQQQQGKKRRRRRKRRDRGPQSGDAPRDQDDRPDERPAALEGPKTEISGLLEMAPKGFGFLRLREKHFEQAKDDPFVSPELVRQYGLRVGVWIDGLVQQGPRGPQLVDITAVNDLPPEEARKLPAFEELKAVNPSKKVSFETTQDRYTTRVIDLVSPIGRGQRGLIVSPPRSGKTTLLLHVAEAVQELHDETTHLMVLLVDERPEEVTEFRRQLPEAEIYASSNDEPRRNHTRIAEICIERAKRLVEAGQHVFLLMDSITRLARAYNGNTRSKGRGVGSGGITVGALETPRRLFAAARNTREAGSLTILATALIQTNSRADDAIFQEFKGTGNMELVLDRKVAEHYIYPAVDIFKSGTRREELLLADHTLHKINMIRRGLSGHRPEEAMERLLFFLKKFPNNPQMLLEIKG